MPAMVSQFQAALPPHIKVEKFVRVVMTAISTAPALVDADRNSLLAACLRSASDGLIPDGREAALVPYKGKVSFMPMIGGILKKIRNSGELSAINSEIVFKEDFFEYHIDQDGVHFKHKPNFDVDDRGDARGVYTIAKTKDGGVYFEYMTKAQVEDVRKASPGKDGPAWTGAFKHEMWKKSVTKRLSKRLPSSTDIDPSLFGDEIEVDPVDSPSEVPAKNVEATVEPAKTAEPAAKKSKLKSAMESTVKDVAPEQKIDSEPPQQVVPDEEIPI